MIKFIVIIGAVLLLYKLFANDFLRKHHEKEEKKQAKDQQANPGELVKDPVCGTYVSKDESISVKDGDKVYKFCSYDCRDKFLKQIEQDRAISDKIEK